MSATARINHVGKMIACKSCACLGNDTFRELTPITTANASNLTILIALR